MSDVRRLADMIAEARRVVVFTGAGISTESGIPDFRSPGGVWSTMKPIYFQDFMDSEDRRREAWERAFSGRAGWTGASPNAAWRAARRHDRPPTPPCGGEEAGGVPRRGWGALGDRSDRRAAGAPCALPRAPTVARACRGGGGGGQASVPSVNKRGGGGRRPPPCARPLAPAPCFPASAPPPPGAC